MRQLRRFLPLGHFLLTVLLIGQLLASTPSRVVVVSSFVHAKTIKYDSVKPVAESSGVWAAMKLYGQSKLANILFTKELARRLEGEEASMFKKLCMQIEILPSFLQFSFFSRHRSHHLLSESWNGGYQN